MVGRKLARGSIELSSSPAYLLGPSGKVKEILKALETNNP